MGGGVQGGAGRRVMVGLTVLPRQRLVITLVNLRGVSS